MVLDSPHSPTEARVTEEAYNLAQALPQVPEKPSAAFTGLARLPSARRPELRPARGVPNLTRMGNREAIVAQSVGAPAPSPYGDLEFNIQYLSQIEYLSVTP